MGSMALQLRLPQPADPAEWYRQAVTLRDLVDQRRYRRLQQEALELKMEEDREQMAQARNLRDLFRTNPNPTAQEVMAVAPGSLGLRYMTEQRQAEAAETQAKTAVLTQQQELQKVQQNLREQFVNGLTAVVQEKDPARRATLYPQIQQNMRRTAGPYLTPDLEALISQPLPDENGLLSAYGQVHGPKALQELLDKRAAETRATAKDQREAEDAAFKASLRPYEARKTIAEAASAEQKATGTEPITGTLREFKQVFLPGWLQSKGIAKPTARDEMAAYTDFRELLRARIGGVPGVDVPYPEPVAEQKVAMQKATAEAKPATEGERKALGFYTRLKDAEDVMGTLESWISNLTPAAQLRLKAAPDWAQTEHGQLYKQAIRQFTEARLRKESGAAIAPSEYATSERIFFPQPLDQPETLKRKAQARKTVMDAVRRESGRAYTQAFGEGEPPTEPGSTVQWERGPDGKPRRKQ